MTPEAGHNSRLRILRAIPAAKQIPPDAAISIRSITHHASRRIVQAAFEYAVKHGRRRVTAVHKANVLRATCGVFLEAAREVAGQYPQIVIPSSAQGTFAAFWANFVMIS